MSHKEVVEKINKMTEFAMTQIDDFKNKYLWNYWTRNEMMKKMENKAKINWKIILFYEYGSFLPWAVFFCFISQENGSNLRHYGNYSSILFSVFFFAKKKTLFLINKHFELSLFPWTLLSRCEAHENFKIFSSSKTNRLDASGKSLR